MPHCSFVSQLTDPLFFILISFLSFLICLGARFMRDNLLSEILEALIVIRGLIVQKTKLISDCNRLLKDLLDGLLLESSENKRQFIRACICGLQIHGEERKGRTSLVWMIYPMLHLPSIVVIFYDILNYYQNFIPIKF